MPTTFTALSTHLLSRNARAYIQRHNLNPDDLTLDEIEEILEKENEEQMQRNRDASAQFTQDKFS